MNWTISDVTSFNMTDGPEAEEEDNGTRDNRRWDDIMQYVDQIDLLKHRPVVITIVIIYAVVIVLGTLGSVLVFVTIVKMRSLWTPTNTFIANLAVADIFVCSFNLPLTLHYQLTEDWVFGQPLCHVIPAVFAISNYSTTLTLAVVALDRYQLVVSPLEPKITRRMAVLIVFGIGIISIAASTPIAVFANYHEISIEIANIRHRYCVERWPNVISREIFTAVSLLLQFFIPLVVVAFLYYLIYIRLRRRINTKNTNKNKTNKMILAVVTVFACTWMPYHILSIISEFWGDHVTGLNYFRLLDLLLRVLAQSSSCINPFLYGWMNSNFRVAFVAILRRPLTTTPNVNIKSSPTQQNRLRQLKSNSAKDVSCNLAIDGV